jgi:hypothetical protein
LIITGAGVAVSGFIAAEGFSGTGCTGLSGLSGFEFYLLSSFRRRFFSSI